MNGALLKKWMDENRVRPEELAAKLGISYSTVYALLAGKTNTRLSTIRAVSQLTGIPEGDLRDREAKAAS